MISFLHHHNETQKVKKKKQVYFPGASSNIAQSSWALHTKLRVTESLVIEASSCGLEGDFSHKYVHRQFRGWACLEAWCTVPRLCCMATLQIIYKHFPTVWEKKLCVWHLTSESKSKHTRSLQNLEVMCLWVLVWKGSSYIHFIYCYISSIQCDCQECECSLCCSFSNSPSLPCIFRLDHRQTRSYLCVLVEVYLRHCYGDLTCIAHMFAHNLQIIFNFWTSEKE